MNKLKKQATQRFSTEPVPLNIDEDDVDDDVNDQDIAMMIL